jgi:hypothetical protein
MHDGVIGAAQPACFGARAPNRRLKNIGPLGRQKPMSSAFAERQRLFDFRSAILAHLNSLVFRQRVTPGLSSVTASEYSSRLIQSWIGG